MKTNTSLKVVPKKHKSRKKEPTKYGFFQTLDSVKEDVQIKTIPYPEKKDRNGRKKHYSPLIKLRWKRIKKPKTIRPTTK